ncbi:hypothetical protein C8R45DRAFT_1098885 [Mycena sanguinolenta]|nr:hypothetical protein C8R45DRAFT_1098885 [Mycena sanguinolenta]
MSLPQELIDLIVEQLYQVTNKDRTNKKLSRRHHRLKAFSVHSAIAAPLLPLAARLTLSHARTRTSTIAVR